MPTRVVVQGPGNVGRPAIRAVLASPALELAGVLVHSPAKEGADAGELAGMASVGVPATRDGEALLAARPDAWVYAANQDFRPAEARAEMCRVLEAGTNVVTAGLYALLHPPSADPALRARFEAACRTGGSSFLTSGIDPGFATDLLPLVASGMVESFDEIRIREVFNYATYAVPPAVRAIIGFGSPMERRPPMIAPGVPSGVWGPALRALGAGLELAVDEVREAVETHPLERDVEAPWGETLAKGTLGAFRFEVQAWVGGAPALVLEHVTRIADDTAPHWPRAARMGFHQVRITGRPSLTWTIEAEDEAGDHAAGGNASAAARLVHAIPFVCAAPPGLLCAADVPPVPGRGLLRRC